MTSSPLFAILGMAIVTYFTRIGGLWLIQRVELTPRIERWLQQIPGAILVSLVAPAVVLGGVSDSLAAVLTLITGLVTKNVLVTMIVGVVVVAILRGVFTV